MKDVTFFFSLTSPLTTTAASNDNLEKFSNPVNSVTEMTTDVSPNSEKLWENHCMQKCRVPSRYEKRGRALFWKKGHIFFHGLFTKNAKLFPKKSNF